MAYTDLTDAPLWVQVPIYVLAFFCVAIGGSTLWDLWRHRDDH